MSYLGTYHGRDVLLEQPNRVISAPDGQELERRVQDPGTGPRKVDQPSPVPAGVRRLEMLAMDLGEAYELRRFFLARRGRQRSFWMPTWQQDLILAAAAGAGAGTVLVRECGYAARMWPHAAARRHLLLRAPGGGTVLMRRVSAAVSNGDGTETLTLVGDAGETTHGVAIAADWLVCFLQLMRLDQDTWAFRWRGRTTACELAVRELPAEVPA